MERLPPLCEPSQSSRITNFQEYTMWQRQKKQAYRAELSIQIEEQSRSKSHILKQKQIDRTEINKKVQNQQRKWQQGKYSKINTERKYMADNYNLMKQTSKHTNPREQEQQIPIRKYKEHPFVKLVDEEQVRKQQTKQHFIFQNKLNAIQLDMKRQLNTRRKRLQSEERKMYIDHVEHHYKKHEQDRELFQNKYLKINKMSKETCKKEYLSFLKEQAEINKSYKGINNIKCNQSSTNASPGNIGQSPLSGDRKIQLQKLQKSLKLFNQKQRLMSSLQFHNSQLINPQCHNGMNSQRSNYQKVVTEKASTQKSSIYYTINKQDVFKQKQSKIVSQPSQKRQNIIKKPENMQKLLSYPSERLGNNTLDRHIAKKLYKQYDIIKGVQTIYS